MVKWGDYGISRASYSNGLLERVEVRANPGERLGDREVWTREQVIAALVLGARLVTMREVPAGGWVKVDDIGLITAGDDLFVRVGGDVVPSDNLGELDAFFRI